MSSAASRAPAENSERRRRLRTFPSALIDEQHGHSSRPAANIFIAV